MTSTLSHSYITQLPRNFSRVTELRWSIDWWKRHYAEAGEQKELAWKMYFDAIDNGDPRKLIDDLYETVQMFESICREAWGELQEAKRELLALLN